MKGTTVSELETKVFISIISTEILYFTAFWGAAPKSLVRRKNLLPQNSSYKSGLGYSLLVYS
jgi:hypothetical protein